MNGVAKTFSVCLQGRSNVFFQRNFLTSDSREFIERVHSKIKFFDKIKLDPNIMLFALFFSKNVSIPSDINSGPKISLPGTCIITFEDLHFHFWDLHYCFRTCIITSGTCIITSRIFIIVLFYCNISVKKNKTNGGKWT